MNARGTSRPDRRQFLTTAGGIASGLIAASQTHAQDTEHSDAARQTELKNPKVGQPVSQTAKAQGGQPVVPSPQPRKLGFCIVGLGKFAVGQILPAFQECEHARPVALVSGDREKAQAIANAYGIKESNTYNYHDFRNIADNEEIDVVYIILPNALHAEYSILASQAGKHVLCEKPMATTVEDCHKMIAAADVANRKLMIAYRVQYEPYNMKAIEWSRNQKYGPIQFITSDTVLDVGGPNEWRLDKTLFGGGSLMDIGIYSVNAMCYLTGETPIKANAIQFQNKQDPRFTDVEQMILFQLQFPSGVITNCSSSYSTETVNRYTVAFRDGWLKLDPATSYTGHRFFHGKEGRVEQLFLPHVSHFAAEMDHLAQAIKNNQPVRTPGDEGLRDVKIMKKIYEAAAEGRTMEIT